MMPRAIQLLTLTLALAALSLVLAQCAKRPPDSVEKVTDEHRAGQTETAPSVVQFAAPATPSAPILVPGDARLAVSWNAVPGAASYELYWSPGEDSAAPDVRMKPVSGLHAVIEQLTNGRTYHVWLKAVNGLGLSSFSTSASSAARVVVKGVEVTAAAKIAVDAATPPSIAPTVVTTDAPPTGFPTKTTEGSDADPSVVVQPDLPALSTPAFSAIPAGTAYGPELVYTSVPTSPADATTDPAALPATLSLDEVVAIGGKQRCEISDLAKILPSIGQVLPRRSAFAERAPEALRPYTGGEPLTKGRASSVLARVLKPSSSLVYMILPFDRYAFRAFLGEGVFAASSSPGDVMTGTELLELVAIVTVRYGDLP